MAEQRSSSETRAEIVPLPIVSDVSETLQAELDRLFPAREIERVLLIVPPNLAADAFSFRFAQKGRYENFPPYGLGVLASHLRAGGIEVSILNLHHHLLKTTRSGIDEDVFDYDEVVGDAIAKELRAFRPDLVGVTCMFSATHASAVNVCSEVRRIHPHLPLVAGGVHITNALQDATTRDRIVTEFSAVDALFSFESELALAAFVRAVNDRNDEAGLAQMTFLADSDLTFAKRMVPEGADLDVMPALDLLQLPELTEHGTIGTFHPLVEHGTRFATALFNRGCRAQCTFCSVRSFNGVGVRQRSVAAMLDELAAMRDEYGIGHLMWLDDDFLYDRRRSIELFDGMIDRELGLSWDCSNGVIAAACKDEVLAAAAEAGCMGLVLGMESGNPEILKRIRKPGTVDVFMRAAERLRQFETINARVFLMIGFPGETYRMIRETFEVAREMALDWHVISKLNNLPNTPLFRQASDEERRLKTKQIFGAKHYATGGAYLSKSKHDKLRETHKASQFSLDRSIVDVFDDADPDAIPTDAELDRIWVYMHFHLNFMRTLREERPEKLKQAYRYLKHITDVAGPDNAMAFYCRAVVHRKLYEKSDHSAVERLGELLIELPFWEDRLAEFGLRPGDLDD